VPHRKHNTSPLCSQELWPLDHRGSLSQHISQYDTQIDLQGPWITEYSVQRKLSPGTVSKWHLGMTTTALGVGRREGLCEGARPGQSIEAFQEHLQRAASTTVVTVGCHPQTCNSNCFHCPCHECVSTEAPLRWSQTLHAARRQRSQQLWVLNSWGEPRIQTCPKFVYGYLTGTWHSSVLLET
jgi:hypothetical protein